MLSGRSRAAAFLLGDDLLGIELRQQRRDLADVDHLGKAADSAVLRVVEQITLTASG